MGRVEFWCAVCCASFVHCAPPAATRAASAARPAHEARGTVLSREQARRIDLRAERVSLDAIETTRAFVGEVLAPPGRSVTLTAPIAGTVRWSATRPLAAGQHVAARSAFMTIQPLAPADRDVRAQASRQVALAAARVTLAEQRLQRTSALQQRDSSSRRAVEEAQAELDSARAELRAARARQSTLSSGPMNADVTLAVRAPVDARIRALTVADGQVVAAGAPLAELVDTSARWVRVAVALAEWSVFDGATDVRAFLGDARARVALAAIDGPPTADFANATRDRWFIAPAEVAWPPGARLTVEVRKPGARRPTIAIEGVLFDALGSAFVYVERGPLTFERQRVRVEAIDAERATIASGLSDDAVVVTRGAVELAGLDAPGGH